jgi:anti-sigma-K factor RskA
MSAAGIGNERLAGLLVDDTTEGLTASEALELRGLLARHQDVDAGSIERTAAALLLASTLEEEPLPPAVRRRLDLTGEAFVAQHYTAVSRPADAGALPAPAGRNRGRVAWLAAAACFALALFGWWPRLAPHRAAGHRATSANPVADMALDRSALLSAGTAIEREWSATEDPDARGVTGDVVWDNAHQRGYMRFRGLPANDPRRSQYQLWIFDRARSEQYPVDGGVFDAPAAGDEILVPIDARLPIADPTLFAVTIEKPGGVVVSSRQHIVVVAKGAAS